MKVTRKRTTIKGLRSRLGRLCWFIDPRTDECVEGFYKEGRRVERTVKGTMTRTERLDPVTGAWLGTDYDGQVQIFTVPAHIKITFGMAPAELVDRGIAKAHEAFKASERVED